MIRATVALLGVLAVTGCIPATISSPSRSVSLAQGDIIATSPEGYCIDDVASQPANDFAIFAPCATLGSPDPIPRVIGFATVQIGPADSGAILEDELALRDYLITDEGAALLSQEGEAERVDILSTQAFNDQVMVHFTDTGAPPFAGLQNEEWRAFTAIGGRLVTIGVRGLGAAPLADGPGATLLKRMLAGVKGATIDEVAEVLATDA